jgi:trehalose/maltose hydrolase-like predicted phosphorylase
VEEAREAIKQARTVQNLYRNLTRKLLHFGNIGYFCKISITSIQNRLSKCIINQNCKFYEKNMEHQCTLNKRVLCN